MWEFTAHKFIEPNRWRWARVSEAGRTIQKSPSSYASLGTALANAMLYGFDGAKDPFRLVELK